MTIQAYIDTIKAKTVIKPLSVLEIGSRDGLHAIQLADAFIIPRDQVYVVEANPYCYNNIKASFPDVNTFNFAISDRNGKFDFHAVNPDQGDVRLGQSSLLNKKNKLYDSIATKIKVDCYTGYYFLELADLLGVSLCKIDVEGATLNVLKSFGDRLRALRSLHIECEHRVVWDNQFLYEDVAAYLKNMGYSQLFFDIAEGLQSDSVWVINELIKE